MVAANFESGDTSSGSEELTGDDLEEYQQLLEEHHALCLEQEELTAMGMFCTKFHVHCVSLLYLPYFIRGHMKGALCDL